MGAYKDQQKMAAAFFAPPATANGAEVGMANLDLNDQEDQG